MAGMYADVYGAWFQAVPGEGCEGADFIGEEKYCVWLGFALQGTFHFDLRKSNMTTKADRHTPSNRPKKSEADKRARQKVHRKRLVNLGLAEDKVAKMTPQQMRTLLRHPAKIKV